MYGARRVDRTVGQYTHIKGNPNGNTFDMILFYQPKCTFSKYSYLFDDTHLTPRKKQQSNVQRSSSGEMLLFHLDLTSYTRTLGENKRYGTYSG